MSESLNLKVLYGLPSDGQWITVSQLAALPLMAGYSAADIRKSLEHLVSIRLAVKLDGDRFARADRDSTYSEPLVSLAELMAQIATTLIHNDPSEVGERITDALERVTRYTGADRGYVFDYDFEQGVIHHRYEWCMPGVEPQIHILPVIPLDGIAEREWVARHRRAEAVVFDDVSSLEASALRDWLILQGIKSIVSVPVMGDGECLGFVGFDSVREHRQYGKEQVRLLEILARMLANLHWKELARRELGRASDNLDIIVEGTGVGTWLWQPGDGSLEINENWARMLGYTRGELEPISILTWERLVHPDDLVIAKSVLQRNLDGILTQYDMQVRMRHKAGHWILVQTRGKLMLRDPSDGRVFVGIHQDVTERERANQELKLLSDIINRSPVVAFRWSNQPGWPVEYVSPTIETFGYRAAEFISRQRVFNELIHPDDVERIGREVSGYIAHGPDVYKQIYRLRHGDGHWIWVDDFTWLTRDEQGVVVEINGVLLDISQSKRLERDLRLHATLIDNSVDVVVLRDRDLKYRTANQGFLNLAGKGIDEVVGQTDVELFGDRMDRSYIDQFQANARRALALGPGESFVMEDKFPEVSGPDREFRSRHFPVYDEETNELLGAATISIEITDLKRAQSALLNSEHRFRSLFEQSPVSIMMHHPETGEVLEANEQALRFYEVSSVDELRHIQLWDEQAPFGASDALGWIRKAAREGRQNLEWRSIRTSGSVVWESVTLEPIWIEGSLRVMAIGIDITDKVIAQQELVQSEARFRGILEHLPNVAVQGYGQDKRVLFWNDGSENLYGFTAEEALGQVMTDLIIPKHKRASLLEQIDQWFAGGEPIPAAEVERFDKQGNRKRVFSSKALRETPSGSRELYCIDVDLTSQRQAQKRLELLARVFSHSYDGVVITDGSAIILEVNDRFCEMTGYSREEVIGQNPSMLHSGRQDQAFYESMWSRLKSDGFWIGQIWNRKKSGELYAIETRITMFKDAEDQVTNYIANVTDITERLGYEDKLRQVAFFDELTGLANRSSVSQTLRDALARHRLLDLPLAVVFIDLDEFKSINDQHSHEMGDRYLKNVARRLESIIRTGDVAARFGGDEFVLIIQNLEVATPEHPVFERLLRAMRDPVLIDDKALKLTASFGVTFYPQDGVVDADQLLRQADQAMYSAKQRGKNQIVFFDTVFERSMIEKNLRTEALQRAINRGELVLHYQPQVDMAAGKVLAVEALVRWNYPQDGLLYPLQFLDLIQGHEQLGSMLTNWVLNQALSDLHALDAAGQKIGMSINIIIPASEGLRSHFLNGLRLLLEQYPSLAPDRLMLEVVENILIDDLSLATKIIQEIQALGVQISLDDFGTGFSSLAYLKHLSFDELKIDQGFVRDMLSDREDMTIVQAVISLSQSFNVPVIAEGVETARHAEMLLRLGCQRAQGYAIAKPMPLEALRTWLDQWRPDPSWKSVTAIPSQLYPVATMMAAHEGWVESLDAYRRAELSDPPCLDVDACGFAELLHQYQSVDQFGAIRCATDSLHRALHQAAGQVVSAVQAGRAPEASRQFERVVELSTQLRSVVWGCLERVKQ